MESFEINGRLEDLEFKATKNEKEDFWVIKLYDHFTKKSNVVAMTGEEFGASLALGMPHAGEFENKKLTNLLYEVAEPAQHGTDCFRLIP